MKKIGILSLCCITLVLIYLVGNMDNKNAIASTMTEKLQKEGYSIKNFTFKDRTITATIQSNGQSKIEAKDILTLRKVRNEARMQVKNSKITEVTDINEVIVNNKGETIYESTIKDSFKLPVDNESQAILDTNIALSFDEVKSMLENSFQQNGINVEVTLVSESQLPGNFVSLELLNHKNDYAYINHIVPKIQQLIEEQNDYSAKIVEYTLAVKSTDNKDEILFLLSADLLYRDFLWWQSPEFENQTWTKSSPQASGESTGASQEIQSDITPEDAANAN